MVCNAQNPLITIVVHCVHDAKVKQEAGCRGQLFIQCDILVL